MGTGSSKVSSGGSGGFKLIKNAKEFNSTAEADAFFGNNLDALTKKQKDALTWYTGGDFYDFNQALRNDAPENLDKLKSMDAAMKKSVLTEPITVSRGSTADLLGFKSKPTIAELKELIGGEFMDKAFVSTSAKKGGGFTGDIGYKITVPPGKGRGQYIEQISKFKGSNEVEFLLNRNTKFRVTSVSGDNSYPIVHLQVVD